MRRLLAVVPVLALLALAVAVPAPALSPSLEKEYRADGCAKPSTRGEFHSAARKAYDGRARATRRERRTLRRVIRCQAEPGKSRPIIAKHRSRYRNLHVYRLAVDRLTPYGRWAIPEYIVACESGGSWAAYNPSGASGPYQLLGWGAPMPANTRARRLEHHRIASRLWAGGAGASHWVCA